MRPPSRFSSRSSYVPRSQISTVPGAVLPGRDRALERRVVERVVLDVHREVALARRGTGALSGRPSSRGRRPARAAGRSGAAARRAAGSRRSAPSRGCGAAERLRASSSGRAFSGSRGDRPWPDDPIPRTPAERPNLPQGHSRVPDVTLPGIPRRLRADFVPTSVPASRQPAGPSAQCVRRAVRTACDGGPGRLGPRPRRRCAGS